MLKKKKGDRTIALNGEAFTSKGGIRNRVQEILRRPLGPVDDIAFRFLCALFEHHPWYDEKVGDGIHRIHVVKVMPYGHHGFEIEHHDGTRIDISYRRCLEKKSQRTAFRLACRTVAVEMVKEAKDLFFSSGGSVCPINGEPISRDRCHADHEPPWTFEAIVTAFIDAYSIDVDTVKFVSDHPFKGARYVEDIFADREMWDRFDAFHRERAKLKIMSAKANTVMLHASHQ